MYIYKFGGGKSTCCRPVSVQVARKIQIEYSYRREDDADDDEDEENLLKANLCN